MAKKFRFRPEIILKLREQREQLARRQLAAAQGTVTEIQDRIRNLQGQLEDETARVRQGVLTGTVDVQYMSYYRRHAMSLHRSMIQQAQTLRQAAGQLHKAREEVISASKERKVMTKLKENLLARYKSGLNRQEQLESEDMTATRFQHQHIEQGY